MSDTQRILVFGAGAIGSLYAGRLAAAGESVTLLARGRRLQQLESTGLRLIETRTGEVTVATPAIVDRIDPVTAYDVVLLCVRADQVEAALPVAAEASADTIVPMVNHATGFDQWAEVVGRHRPLIGFPGAGAEIESDGVHFGIPSRLLQQTTLGELDGARSERLERLARSLRRGGFTVATSPRIDAWQRYHAAYIAAFLLGIRNLEGDIDRFLTDSGAQRQVFAAIKESFTLLDRLGHPVTPSNLRSLKLLPIPVLTRGLRVAGRLDALRQMFASSGSRLAQQEAPTLGEQILSLADAADVTLPHYRALLAGRRD
ncbi:MAG: 2-dehydropantoate 2-reductase N-terminal domain-containing protein [Nocardioides sp.]